MPRKQQKKMEHIRSNGKRQTELQSWTKLISTKLLTDYAIPLTKNAEAQLHKLNEKLEEARL